MLTRVNATNRSSGAYALSIWTRYLKNVSFQSNWKVPGSHNETDTVLVAASGLNYGDAVRHALKYDHVVVSGNDATVGLGGHIQGGGHGPLSSTFGLASDNVYQVRAVTTQGDIITADATQNQDLWWALKGGGAGQYAIVTEYVLKAHPAPSVVQMGFSISSKGNSLAANESTWKALSSFLRQVPDLMDAGLAGAMVIQGHHDGAVSVNQGFYAFGKSKAEAERLNNQIISRIRSAAGGNSSVLSVTASETSDPIPYKTFFEALNAAGSNQAGAVSVPTSHLLGRPELSEIDDDTLISYLRRAITNSVPSNSGYGVFGLQGGPGPAKTPENMRGALLPAWRHTYLHAMSYSTTVDTSLKPSELFRQVSEDINENKETLWKEWAPNTGAYMNEANPFDPDFKNNFYGSSYDRLVEIKKKYDPTESLWVLSGVGSDEWDYDLDTGKLCKI